ncbi:5-oxoprolinase [Brevundimonas sp. Leaf363]|uniref:hydantoinase B/oxoprolinase family protein n=1 Tax=Brevundimonas sp. Leaf363 TaxID=1736353 RepID=UPI0006F711BD|nr:hydantoinase B/oxoprolinase family protein [Brevundimonas sp. Leaf363]KQS55347.1 5-oxoprolinase [Brevundimonas sp. Leaf363]
MADASSGWRFWIDRGGTFTDIVARAPDGSLKVDKLLSVNPERYADAAVEGVRRFVATDPAPIEAVRMGTTVATNALLERKGARTALAITAGLGDALKIGWQSRPALFDLNIRLPEPLYDAVLEIDERIGADGAVVRPMDVASARAGFTRLRAEGIEALAIVLMHGWRHTAHERWLAEIAAEVGFAQVSVSHEVAPLIKLISRGDTTVADAYLSPVLRAYVDRVATALGAETELQFMQSNGGLTAARSFRGKDAILSGPAGGVVGMAATAEAAGFSRVIGFDMGGTSTDVSHYAGAYERVSEKAVAGARLRAPMLDIHTVAAGGGSICRFDGSRLRVGPESAGADPGPVAYRRGGPLSITDCNLMLGKLRPEDFPAVFGPDGDLPLDATAVREAFDALCAQVEAATGQAADPLVLAEGFVEIAVQNMAEAIKAISIQRGHDLTGYVLHCFGGAGGQHACKVADALGMTQVLLHPFAGVLSALGMGLSDVRELREATAALPLEGASDSQAEARIAALADEAKAALVAQGFAADTIEIERRAAVRFDGSDTSLLVDFGPAEGMAEAFEAQHRRRFGYGGAGRRLVIESLQVEAVGRAERPDLSLAPEAVPASAIGAAAVRTEGAAHQATVWRREALGVGAEVAGPALVLEATGTVMIEPGWSGRIDPLGNLILTRKAPLTSAGLGATAVDPVRLELFNSRFMAAAEQMGEALRATASSVNIKERLDFSCAVFDAGGALIANAPHIPVHLGSMGESVAAVVRARGDCRDGRGLKPGDVYMLNAPYNGGTHLPDITVLMPIFLDDDAPAFFVAARGHHADVGGRTPGSMPPDSTSVEEEGVLIDDFLLVDQGRLREVETRALMASGPWPSRNVDQNLADLAAQIAACQRGADELRRMVGEFGRPVVEAYMGHVQDNAEEAVRRALSALKSGAAEIEMDDGACIRVRIDIDADARSAVIDFTGTSAQRPNNFNAPSSITRAATLYVLRTLVDDAIPLNDGCLRAVELIVPEGSMLKPRYPAAVVAGNVETSQAVVDALYAALGVVASSQGTMNNFTFGDDRRQYYETIAGGSGAGPGFDGADAVQTHMTNSRLTDPEVLEMRFPVRLETFAIRRGSGGAGRWTGGNGVVRKVRFLEPMTAAILSNRRRVPPQGAGGGSSAAPGVNALERTDGSVEALSSTATVTLGPGDAMIIQTPGGGGFGE